MTLSLSENKWSNHFVIILVPQRRWSILILLCISDQEKGMSLGGHGMSHSDAFVLTGWMSPAQILQSPVLGI